MRYYMHYRTKDVYEVLHQNAVCSSNNDENQQAQVVYKRLTAENGTKWLYGEGRVFVRRQDEFFGSVDHEGRTRPRFEPVQPTQWAWAQQ